MCIRDRNKYYQSEFAVKIITIMVSMADYITYSEFVGQMRYGKK